MALVNIGELLFMNSEFADVIFVVDNEEIPGNRNILAVTLPYFKKLLYGDFKECESNRVEISGISAKAFKEVIRFIYLKKIEISGWSIEDLLALLSLAHKYLFDLLFSEVIQALKQQPLDFHSWKLVDSAGAIYDSDILKLKCSSFAKEKFQDFRDLKHLELFSAEFICWMLDSRKVSSCNQDQLLGAICKWKQNHTSDEIMSLFQKISWEEVSPELSAIILKESLYAVKNLSDCNFWMKLDGKIRMQSECILRLDKVHLVREKEVNIEMPKFQCSVDLRLSLDFFRFSFKKNDSRFTIPVKGIEFVSGTQFILSRMYGVQSDNTELEMVFSDPIATIAGFKYSASFSKSTPGYYFRIDSRNFGDFSKMELKNVIVY